MHGKNTTLPSSRSYARVAKEEWERCRSFRWFCAHASLSGRTELEDAYKHPSEAKKKAWLSILMDAADLRDAGGTIVIPPLVVSHTHQRFVAGFVYSSPFKVVYREYRYDGFFEFVIKDLPDREALADARFKGGFVCSK